MSRRAPDTPRCAHCETTRGRLIPTRDGLRCRRCRDRMPTGLRRRLLQQPNKPGPTVNPNAPTQGGEP